MDHVAAARDAQRALGNVPMKPRRLLIDVDQPVLLASNNDDGHFQSGVLLARCKRVGAVSAALARI